jgi:RNA polymerase sigma-70 factor, ECF subfamily
MDESAQLQHEMRVIASILDGESHLFRDLIRPYERQVHFTALSFCRNHADAEDVAQEAFLKAYRNLTGFRGESKFGRWLITIAQNEARGCLRRRNAFHFESLDQPQERNWHDTPALLRDGREIPLKSLERQEVRSALQKAIGLLPPIYRHIVLLRDVEDLSIAESAELLQISSASVKVRLHRARTMLRKDLSRRLNR